MIEIRCSNKKLNETLAPPTTSGWFALDRSPIEWIDCRERFTPLIRRSHVGFYFSHSEGEGEAVAGFIRKTEEILDVPFSTFYQTNRYYATWIEPSEFWMECQMRLSLLTILVRAGLRFDPHRKNYEECLYGHPYVKLTQDAVQRFLCGFTNFVPPRKNYCHGWVFTFKNQSLNKIRDWLVLPKGKENPFPELASTASLWS